MTDNDWCRHEANECDLKRLIDRHHQWCRDCEALAKQGHVGCTTESVLYGGENAYSNAAMRSAFRKGWDARAAGVNRFSHPYRDAPRYRRGRWTRGFAPAFEAAWKAGWAWADHYALIQGSVWSCEDTLVFAWMNDSRPGCFAKPGPAKYKRRRPAG